jgi:hypothetical protein
LSSEFFSDFFFFFSDLCDRLAVSDVLRSTPKRTASPQLSLAPAAVPAEPVMRVSMARSETRFEASGSHAPLTVFALVRLCNLSLTLRTRREADCDTPGRCVRR